MNNYPKAVYPDVESARIDPQTLGSNCDHSSSHLPAYLRRWFKEAHTIYNSEELSHAYKTGYLYGVLQIVENYFGYKEQ